MTPTLIGRWQTRILLFLLVQLPITVVFAYWLAGFTLYPAEEPFIFLSAILAVGLLLDIVYQQIQRFRWDNDWPFAFFVFFSFVEFGIAFGLMRLELIPGLASCLQARIDPATRALVCQVYAVPFTTAITHFLLVFVPSLLAVLGGLQVFLVRWRFKGGELGRLPVSE